MLSDSFNPFPGLRPFRSDEHHLFFGRETQTAELLRLLREHRFLAIVGTSGSGKSSLVRAGLIPELHRGTMARAGSAWEVVVLRPGANPIRNLARALLAADLYDTDDADSLPRLQATLTRSRFGLVEAVRQSDVIEPETNLLIVVDQFEELFRYRQQSLESEENTGAFVSLLLAAAQQQQQSLYVAITMRSDYLGDCAQIPGLAEAVNRGEYLIPRLLRDQQREAIEKPVGVGGAQIAPRLVQRMLNDVGDDPDLLPVLQHALMRTWDAWSDGKANGAPLDLDHYESTGGTEESLSRHADEIYFSLPDDEHRLVCQRLFQALTEKGADNRGIRRPTRLAQLVQIVGARPQVVRSVIDAFRQPGVTFLMPTMEQELTDQTVIDLSHESLMRVWTRLTGWVEEEAQSARIYRRLADTAELRQRGQAGLFRDPDLQISLSWRGQQSPTAAWAQQYGGQFQQAMAFLDQSQAAVQAEIRENEAARQRELQQAQALAEAERQRAQEQQRAAGRMRKLAGAVGAVAVVARIALVAAAIARQQSERNARLAADSAQLAKQNAQLAAQKEQAANEAKTQLQQTLAKSDFNVGVEKIQDGQGSEGLTYLARAMRGDPQFWPASVRTLSTLTSGRFSLASLKPIEQTRVISGSWFNASHELLFTWDDGAEIPEGEQVEGFVWDLRTGQQLYQVSPGKKFTQPAWSEDGDRLVAYLPDEKALQAWDARTGEPVGNPLPCETGLTDFRQYSDPALGRLLLIRDEGRTLRVFQLDSGQALSPRLQRAAPSHGQFGFTPNGRWVYAAYSDAIVGVWEVQGGAAVNEFSARPHRVESSDNQAITLVDPTGQYIVVRGEDSKRITWWPIGQPSTPATWIEFENPVWLEFVAGQPRLLALPSNSQLPSQQVSVYDLSTRQAVATISPGGPVLSYVRAYERPFASSGNDRQVNPARVVRHPMLGTVEANIVRIWDLNTGNELQRIVTPALLASATFSPEGRRLATVSVAHELMLWDLFSGRPLLREMIRHEGTVGGPWFRPDGEVMFTHDAEASLVHIWDTRTGDRVTEPVPQMFASEMGQFSARGDRLLLYDSVTTSYGNTSRRSLGRYQQIDVSTRPALPEPLLDATGVAAVARYTHDGTALIVAGKPSAEQPVQLMVFESQTRQLRQAFPLPQGVTVESTPGDGTVLEVMPDDRHVLLACSDGQVRSWDLQSGEVDFQLGHAERVSTIAISGGGSLIASATNSGRVRVWDARTGGPLFEPLDHGSDPIMAIEFSPDGQWIVSGSRDRKVRIADARTGTLHGDPIDIKEVAESLAFSPDGSHLVISVFGTESFVVDMPSGQVSGRLKNPGVDPSRGLRFHPEGRLLALGYGGRLDSPTGYALLWDWRKGQTVHAPINARGPVGHVRFSPDGGLLATGTVLSQPGGSVQVWDVGSGQPLIDPISGAGHVDSLEFHPSRNELVATWTDGSVRIVVVPPRGDSPPDWLPKLAEAVAGRRLTSGSEADEGGGRAAVASLETLRGELAGSAGESGSAAMARWGKWFLADADERAISPESNLLFRDYLARRRQSTRLESLQQVLRMAPTDALTHARLGTVLLDDLDGQTELKEGLRSLWQETAAWYTRRAVELDPTNPEAVVARAEVLRRLGRDSEADAVLASLDARQESESANALYLQALALAGQDKWDEADRTFLAALESIAAVDTESAAATQAPLIGILARLRPTQAPADLWDIRLPEPIPGTFEAFDAVPEGQIPAGWVVRHAQSLLDKGTVQARDLNVPTSAAFQDWTVMSVDRTTTWQGASSIGQRLLSVAANERVNGTLTSPLANGRLLLAVSAGRPGGQQLEVVTPDFDCSRRNQVHVAFHSLFEQNQDSLAVVEYSVDEGVTWQPVVYMVEMGDVVRDAAGDVDGPATLQRLQWDAPAVFDDQGRIATSNYAAFVRAKITQDIGRHISGRRDDDQTASKRVEVFRLSLADGQPKVRLRFALAGSDSDYWGIDDFGLYEVPADHVAERAERIVPSEDAKLLAGLALATFRNETPREGLRSVLDPNDLLTEPPAKADSSSQTASSDSAPVKVDPASLAIGSERRRSIDAKLLARRAAALAPDDPWIALTLATISPNVEADSAMAESPVLDGRPFSRFQVPSWVSHYLAQGDHLEKGGNATAAGVCYELAYVLNYAATGKTRPDLMQRLTAAGLAAKGVLLLPRESQWKYYDLGAALESEWKELAFDDSSWLNGQARLGYGGDGEKTTIGFGPDGNKKHVTTYFRTTFQVERPERFVKLTVRLQRDDGAVVYLNGVEVGRDAMPVGDVQHDTPASVTASNEAETNFVDLEVLSPRLQEGMNVVAVEVHQANQTSSDLGFDLEIEGFAGLAETAPPAQKLDEIETRLAIPDDLRALLWLSRATRFRSSRDQQRAARIAARAAALSPNSPAVLYQQARQLAEQEETASALKAFKQSVEKTVALKDQPPDLQPLMLTTAFRSAIEPLVGVDATNLARAARNGSFDATDAEWLLQWAESLGDSSGDGLLERLDTMITLKHGEAALTLIDQQLAAQREATEQGPRWERELRDWLALRERCLRELDRAEEADEVRDEIVRIPARRPGLDSRLIDLSEHYNASLYDGRGWHTSDANWNNIAMLPETFQPRHGVDFDLRGFVQLNSGTFASSDPSNVRNRDLNQVYDREFPDQVTIRIGRTTPKLHLLLGATWGRADRGDEIARMVVHYADGSEESMPILADVDVADWWINSIGNQTVDPESVGWSDSERVLFEKIWTNPNPQKVIEHVDFVSGKKRSGPFLAGLTAE